MPLTCFCKTCQREVPARETCPSCGEKLNPSTAHTSWEETRLPVLDWICWNGILRIALPVFFVTAALILLIETVTGGLAAAETLLTGGFGSLSLACLAVLFVCTAAVLLLRGRETMTCWADGKGLHTAISLEAPTKLRLIARGLPTGLLKKAREDTPLRVSESHISWREIRRIQLWPQKGLILVYAPRFWQRLAIPCPASEWSEALRLIRERLGKRKDVLLPDAIRPSEKKKGHIHLLPRGKKHAGAKARNSRKPAKASSARKKTSQKGASKSTGARKPSSVSMEEIIAMNEEEARRQEMDSESQNRRR